jgi:hypothetical protein
VLATGRPLNHTIYCVHITHRGHDACRLSGNQDDFTVRLRPLGYFGASSLSVGIFYPDKKDYRDSTMNLRTLCAEYRVQKRELGYRCEPMLLFEIFASH